MTYTPKEMSQMEEQLSLHYQKLVRSNGGMIRLGDQEFQVRVENGQINRQPTLVLEEVIQMPRPATVVSPKPDWVAAFIADLDRVMNVPAHRGALRPVEQVALDYARDEMRSLAESNAPAMSPLLLAGYLSVVEQTTAPRDPERACIYRLALRGLDRLLPSALGHAGTDWTLMQSPRRRRKRLPRWLGRFFGWFLALGDPDEDVLR